jgi:hypothetical protein
MQEFCTIMYKRTSIRLKKGLFMRLLICTTEYRDIAQVALWHYLPEAVYNPSCKLFATPITVVGGKT